MELFFYDAVMVRGAVMTTPKTAMQEVFKSLRWLVQVELREIGQLVYTTRLEPPQLETSFNRQNEGQRPSHPRVQRARQHVGL